MGWRKTHVSLFVQHLVRSDQNEDRNEPQSSALVNVWHVVVRLGRAVDPHGKGRCRDHAE